MQDHPLVECEALRGGAVVDIGAEGDIHIRARLVHLVGNIAHKVMIDSVRLADMLGDAVKIAFTVFIIKRGTAFAFAPAETVIGNDGNAFHLGILFAVGENIFDHLLPECGIRGAELFTQQKRSLAGLDAFSVDLGEEFRMRFGIFFSGNPVVETVMAAFNRDAADLRHFLRIQTAYGRGQDCCQREILPGIDAERITIMGDSAGGNLAAVTAMLARDRKGPQLAGQLLFYPITDCRLRTQSMATYKDSPMLNEKMLSFYVKNYAREPKDILSPMFSPLLSPDLSRLPPALIITAELDPLSDDGKLYAEALQNAGTKANALMAAGAYHGFMPYRDAIGRPEGECAARQFIAGRTVENILLVNERELRRQKQLNI